MTSPRSTACSCRAPRRCRRSAREARSSPSSWRTRTPRPARSPARAPRCEQALSLLPPALNHSTRTFAGLRKTLDSLDPLVAASKPASRRLEPFAKQLDELTRASIPTIGALNDLIRNPSGSGDLISLLDEMPSLASVAHSGVPGADQGDERLAGTARLPARVRPRRRRGAHQLGQAGAYYDANGHYQRTQPVFGAFGLDASNQLTEKPPSDRYLGLQEVHSRCPGGAVQPPPDGSAPVKVPDCNPSTTPPGP